MINNDNFSAFAPLYDILLHGMTETEKKDVSISLFVASATSPGITRLDLNNLSPSQRIEKLQEGAKNNRLVALIQKGDQLYAHMSPQIASQWQGKDLSLDGKKIEVRSLEADYDKLEQVVDALKEEAEMQMNEENRETETIEKDSKDAKKYYSTLQAKNQKSYYVDGAAEFIRRMSYIPEKIKSNILRLFAQDQKRENELKKEREKESKEETHRILKKELNREQLKEEIIAEGIEREVIQGDVESHNDQQNDITKHS